MNQFISGKLSTLARQLEPYVRQWTRDILGNQTGGRDDDKTWIHGTGFPKDDEQETRGQRTASGMQGWRYGDFQLNRTTDDQVVKGDAGYILGGENNELNWTGEAVVAGRGGYSTDGVDWVMGNQFDDEPRSANTRSTMMFGEEYYGGEIYGGDGWQSLFAYWMKDWDRHTFLIESYIAGHSTKYVEKAWHFKLDALMTREFWGTPYSGSGEGIVIWQKSTELYSSGDGVDVRVVGSESPYYSGYTIEAYSEGYQGIRWFVNGRSTEVDF